MTWYASLKNEYDLLPDVPNYFGMISKSLTNTAAFGWIRPLRSYGGETVFDQVKEPFPVAMLPLPTHTAQVPFAQVEDYSILASSAKAPAAWAWIKFLVSQPSAAGNLIPPLKTQVFAKGNPYGLSADLLAVVDRLPEKLIMSPPGMLRSENKAILETMDIYNKAAMQVFNGQADAQTALDLAQSLAEQAFRK